MSFEQLITKVTQAENALEAQERRFAADVRQFKASWRAGWTPGRIVIAGLVSGFVIGRVEPMKTVAKGSNAMQLITMLSGLFASGSAHAAAGQAEIAADSAENVAVAVAPQAVGPAVTARVAATEQATQSAAEAIEP